ncbi:MAG: SDR family oxidoreductase [Gammaproteobacteria bacterium]|nr:3-oxoacyl-ACP reductase [Gammaproteobacteria bacterium]
MAQLQFENHNVLYRCLQGRRVFVTGGATGIGAAIVSAFAAQGAHVAFVDIASEPAEALARRLATQTKVWWRECDVRDIPALQRCIWAAAEELGDFHVLVNNVANDERHDLMSVTPEYWDDRMAVNQRPAFFAIQAVVPGMKRLGEGSIINVGSCGWQIKECGYPAYATAKASLHGLTRGLARALGPDRIRINTLSPGWTITERQKRWLTPEAEAELFRTQCLPDPIQPEDVANFVLFLASDASRMCTGQEYKLDAGWT